MSLALYQFVQWLAAALVPTTNRSMLRFVGQKANSMLRVWGRNSLNVQKVLWLIGELGLEYEHIPAGREFGRLNEPEFRRLYAKFTFLAISQAESERTQNPGYGLGGVTEKLCTWRRE